MTFAELRAERLRAWAKGKLAQWFSRARDRRAAIDASHLVADFEVLEWRDQLRASPTYATLRRSYDTLKEERNTLANRVGLLRAERDALRAGVVDMTEVTHIVEERDELRAAVESSQTVSGLAALIRDRRNLRAECAQLREKLARLERGAGC